VSAPRSLAWFARHELKLSWRDTLSMMTAGRRDRERKAAIGAIVFVLFMHGVAYAVLGRYAGSGIAVDLPTLVGITSSILLAGSAMLSQAMESVTRAFYSRSDLEFILGAPVKADNVFAVRIGAVAFSAAIMSAFLMGSFIDILAWQGGWRWLSAYGVLIAVSLTTTALAVVFTVLLFTLLGPKRTRLAAQIVAAVIGGLFVVGLQIAALFSTGTYSRLAFLHSHFVLTHVPSAGSAMWWPARAVLGEPVSMAVVVVTSALFFLVVTVSFAPHFARFALQAAGTSRESAVGRRSDRPLKVTSAAIALRQKERQLLLRDPWLLSQSLMQLLYLLPPALLLMKSLGDGGGASIILVPVLIMAAGQLAGGLAWLTISGEDAPELVGSSPVTLSRLLRAKVEAVMQCIGAIFLPFAMALALLSPLRAVVALAGITAAAVSSTAIQLWFRSQASRSQFRRRHTSSRIATFAEAFVSITWAGAGAVAAAGNAMGLLAALVVALFAAAMLYAVRSLSPARAQAA
jgi:ABC-2 type transport system permease protein